MSCNKRYEIAYKGEIMLSLQEASKKAGPGGSIRFTEWQAGIHWIVPTNKLMPYEVEFEGDSCTDKAILTPYLLDSNMWEVVEPDIQVGDRVQNLGPAGGFVVAVDKSGHICVMYDNGYLGIKPKNELRLISRPEKPETLVFEGVKYSRHISDGVVFSGVHPYSPTTKTLTLTLTPEVPDESNI
jgi:hypothetical protein